MGKVTSSAELKTSQRLENAKIIGKNFDFSHRRRANLRFSPRLYQTLPMSFTLLFSSPDA